MCYWYLVWVLLFGNLEPDPSQLLLESFKFWEWNNCFWKPNFDEMFTASEFGVCNLYFQNTNIEISLQTLAKLKITGFGQQGTSKQMCLNL